ncbi:uncharacterized protein RCC_09759 [Ramularia collo-cygni]|uniref:MARVEL domain-containing protein n=1 Tax=Ramularia collo-cygni TaxID=112498 RepID=A0A2D3VFU6_9PEZI|nr:uncharacterized protein RCC_09759 [Ramularia collo-cygni]CZT24042.1 uncharacterized protein RCC_09759 [Ramularia collo-cygni]
MANDHVLELPKFVWALKIVQLVFSVLVLALAAVNVSAIAYNAHALSIFTALFSILILVYYFVAIHGSIKLYNWIALLILECLALIFWLSTWAVLAALYATPTYYSYDSYYYWYKRSLEKRITVSDYTGTFISALTFSVINFILYCITLTFISLAAHRHRKAGRPMKYGGTTASATTADIEHQPAPVSPETTQYAPPPQSGVAPTQTQPAVIQPQYTGV